MWYEWLVRGILGLVGCFAGAGKKGKDCHCMMYCDVVTEDTVAQPEKKSPENNQGNDSTPTPDQPAE